MSRSCRLPGPRRATLLAALLALAPVLVHAQAEERPPEYRVEVLVVEPVDPGSDAWPVDEPVRFSHVFDPRLAAALVDAMGPVWPWIDALGPTIPRPGLPRVGLLPAPDEAPDGSPDPEPVTRPWAGIALDALTPALAAARERVERTGEFSAVAALAWLQTAGSSRRPRPMRIHDDVVILRDEVESDEPFGDESGDRGALRSDPLDTRVAPLEPDRDDPATRPEPRADEPAPTRGESSGLYASLRGRALASDEPRREIVPVPQVTLRFDGALALIQRQFLHADLDLRWRSVVQRPQAPNAPRVAPRQSAEDDPTPPPQFEVHRLRQSRAIRPDRWEYFDSERFGVLLRVTELEPLAPLPPPEPTPAIDRSALPAGEPANGSGPDADRP